jgi:uncharacterized membrane protein
MYLLIIIVIVIVLLVSFLISNKEQTKVVEEEKESIQAEKKVWEEDEIKELGEIDSRKKSMLEMIETAFPVDSENSRTLKVLIQDWAKMKEKIFNDRRSWVRKPEEDKE